MFNLICKDILRYIILILLFLLSTQTFCQAKVSETIKTALTNSKDTTDIRNIIKVLGNKYSNHKVLFSFVPSINPLNPNKLKRFSSQFGRRFHPIHKKYKQHLGLDISAKLSTPIHAAADGVVVNTNVSHTGCGNSLKISHKYGFTTRYCHMYLFIVKQNQKVRKGQIIGFVGSTGTSTGPHLHYEIKKNGKLIDPYPFCFLDI